MNMNIPMLENYLPEGKAKHHITAAYNLGIGRWMTPYLGWRVSGLYGAIHWDNDVYSKAIIDTDTKIKAQGYVDIYVQFMIDRETVSSIIDDVDTINNTVKDFEFSYFDDIDEEADPLDLEGEENGDGVTTSPTTNSNTESIS